MLHFFLFASCATSIGVFLCLFVVFNIPLFSVFCFGIPKQSYKVIVIVPRLDIGNPLKLWRIYIYSGKNPAIDNIMRIVYVTLM